MPHADTEDPLVEPPATRGKAEGEMLKAEMLFKSITTAVDDLSGKRQAQVSLAFPAGSYLSRKHPA